MPIQFLVIAAVLFVLHGCVPQQGIYHTVEKGQTLYRISRTYGVNEHYLARLNGIDDPEKLLIGQRVFIPGTSKRLNVAPPKITVDKPAPEKTKKAFSRTSGNSAKENSKTEVRRPTGAPPAEKGKFLWPVKGQVVKEFGSRGGKTSKGLEISVIEGTPVFSAAAGKVTYSGNGIRGYGNLIIIQHDGGFYTIYGFNKQNIVKAGAYVGKGEKIAMSGLPPGGKEGRVHFEIRFGKTAVDPIFYLP